MPRRPNPIPTYRLHKPTGQAVVTVRDPEGRRRDVYLGPYGSDTSRAEYARVVKSLNQPAATGHTAAPAGVTVAEVLLAFLKHAEGYYRRPDGTLTNEIGQFKVTVRVVRELFADLPVTEFGPRCLKAVRERRVELGWCRPLINQRVNRVKQMFKWAASEELLPGALYADLRTVAGLQVGRTKAREPERVRPVPDEVVEKTLPYIRPEVAAMIRVQRLTDCRPGEVCLMRPADIDTSANVWLFRPRYHKLAYRNQPRVIAIGP